MSAAITILLTGGAGYIGSHVAVELLDIGYDVIIVDNLSNSRSQVLRRIEEISGKKVTFYQCDLLEANKVHWIFSQHKIDLVMHFAGLKGVGKSMQLPFTYYKSNVMGTINLIEAMRDHEVYNLVFSSSCTVYGSPESLPITEGHSTSSIASVYGRTKYLIEKMLKDISYAEQDWNIITLRYFNPLGAHPSGRLGEAPTKTYSNLMPILGEVALGKRPHLTILGGDYDTPDGTGVRDYVHIMDLASGHIAALHRLQSVHAKHVTYNLGSGKGVSVLQLVKAFERATETKVPYELKPRREGDVVAIYADISLAQKELRWSTKHSLEEMCKDFWRWQTLNPEGYANDEPVAPASIKSD